MSLILDGLGWRWPDGAAALTAIDLELRPGTLTLLAGPSGGGKSTLLRLAAGLLQRQSGRPPQGRVSVRGVDPATPSPRERAGLVAITSQHPADQLLTDTGAAELHLSARIARLGPDAERAAITALQQRLHLAPLDQGTLTLSGGQQQRLNVAAALIGDAPVLLLDEPLAWLDPQAARRLVDQLAALRDAGLTVLVAEHRVEALLDRCDAVWLLDGGRLRGPAPPASLTAADLGALGLPVPRLLRLRALQEQLGRPPAGAPLEPAPAGGHPLPGWPATRLTRGAFHADLPALALRRGDRVALVGPNGAGKSTWLAELARHPPSGLKVASVTQDPDLSLHRATVREELGDTDVGPRLARHLGLMDLLDRPPHALSRGQRLRVAVGAALATAPDILLLDEPTAGQDHAHAAAVLDLLSGPHGPSALVMATHDLELAALRATRCLTLDGGRLVHDGAPSESLPTWSQLLGLTPWLSWCMDHQVAPAEPERLFGGAP